MHRSAKKKNPETAPRSHPRSMRASSLANVPLTEENADGAAYKPRPLKSIPDVHGVMGNGQQDYTAEDQALGEHGHPPRCQGPEPRTHLWLPLVAGTHHDFSVVLPQVYTDPSCAKLAPLGRNSTEFLCLSHGTCRIRGQK